MDIKEEEDKRSKLTNTILSNTTLHSGLICHGVFQLFVMVKKGEKGGAQHEFRVCEA